MGLSEIWKSLWVFGGCEFEVKIREEWESRAGGARGEDLVDGVYKVHVNKSEGVVSGESVKYYGTTDLSRLG